MYITRFMSCYLTYFYRGFPHYSATAHVTTNPNPDPERSPNLDLNCIPSTVA